MDEPRRALVDDEPPVRQEPPPPANGTKVAYPVRLAVREKERIRLVPVESIAWIQADRNYCLLHTREGRFALRSTLSDLESQLDPRFFARVHRSAIVALGQIRELRPTSRGEYAVTLRDGTSLRGSRGYLRMLRKLLDLTGG